MKFEEVLPAFREGKMISTTITNPRNNITKKYGIKLIDDVIELYLFEDGFKFKINGIQHLFSIYDYLFYDWQIEGSNKKTTRNNHEI